ncbi:hypothetical protein [uncultured Draconibacterium sp.]|uniref:hypothetical protein n=1 Tax=uncultured Draconibacterium sp. TaxID=1573823 RepID=UPI002AA7F344|nr:hypothetical protein [uncultured Draconibacterium sp.]
MTVGPDDVRIRLANVYEWYLFRLKPNDFPEDLQEDWVWINQQLKKYAHRREPGSHYYGAVRYTCSIIRKQTGVKIAQRLLDIYLKLQQMQ